jgi:4-hydroxy-2-oxoheptanedioate aldolase
MMERLRGPGPIHGFWSVTAHPTVLETAASLAPDFIAIDVQHGADLSDISIATFTSMAYYEVPGLVRVASNSPADIGAALDLGAAGVMVPMVDTADDAARAVAACRYSPGGIRSFGVKTPRIDPSDPHYLPLCAVQIETRTGVENANEIAATAGVDWLYVGPADLGLSLGGIGAADVLSVFDGTHPLADSLSAAFGTVVAAAREHGKHAGLHCGSAAATLAARDHGFTVASVATDLIEMRKGMAEHLSGVRNT